MVQRRSHMNQGGIVNDYKPVVEFVGRLDRERAAVLLVELRHIDIVKKLAARIFDDEQRHALPLLRDERKNAIREIRVDDYQFFLRHAHGLKRSSLRTWLASFFAWSAICRLSVASIRARSGAMEAKALRMELNARII